jgi:hypothetical protein
VPGDVAEQFVASRRQVNGGPRGGPGLRVQLDRIDEAVRSVVPQSMWAEILAKLEELEQHPEPLDLATDSFDDADDEPFDPTDFIDQDNEF